MIKKSSIVSFLFAVSLLTPLTVQAEEPRSGTDDYLKNVLGYTDEQLSAEVATEEREPFLSATGVQTVADPGGDALDRNGVTSPLAIPWADLTGAELTRDDGAQGWVLTMTFAETMQDVPSQQVNFLFYADSDGKPENNAPEGVRAGADQWYALVYEQSLGWQTNFRWYNTEAVFWGMDKETAMTYSKEGSTVVFRIPYSELPRDTVAGWRAAVAVSRGSDTQIDVAPGIGFPPPKGQTYPTTDFDMFPVQKTPVSVSIKDIVLAVSVLVFLAAAAFAFRTLQKRRTK